MLASVDCCPHSKRGKRREAILHAAQSLFVEKGYDATTINDIVGRSGGSLATLYDLFENKPGLLRALVGDRCEQIGAAVDRAVSTVQPPEIALRGVGEAMLDRFLDPQYLGMFKIVVTQSAVHPELGQQLYAAGPASGQAKVAQYLMSLAASGTLKIDDPEVAAQNFLQLILGHLHCQLTFGLPATLTQDERDRHLDQAISGFLRIYGA